MERERPSQKWTSAVADPVNNFMETLEREALKRHSAVK